MFLFSYIKRFRIFLFILSFLFLFLVLINLYLKNYNHSSITIENFKDKWLSNLNETQPGVAENLSKFIDNKDWEMLDFCLRFATTSPLCYKDKFEIYQKKLLSFEDLDFYTIKDKRSDFKEGSKYINSESEKWFRENSIIGNRALVSGKTYNEFFKTPDLIKSSALVNGREKIKILAISDSYGVGDGLYNVKETWPRELERQLNLIDNRYEIYVLAAGGANYKDYFNYISLDIVNELDPDIIILSLVSNDFNRYSRELNLSFDESLNISGLNYDILSFISCINTPNNIIKYISFLGLFGNIYNYLLFNYCDNLGFNSNTYTKNPYMDDSSTEDWVNLKEIEYYYKKIINSTKKPIFFFNMLYEQQNEDITNLLKSLNIKILNDIPSSFSLFSELDELCNRYNLTNCYNANPFDYHPNLLYNRLFISKNIDNIYDKIKFIKAEDSSISTPDIIVETMPYQIRYSKSNGYTDIISFDGKSKVIDNFPNSRHYYHSLCANEDRNHIRVNLNDYIIKDKVVKVSLLYNENELLIKSSGYNNDGIKVNSEFKNFEKSNIFSFIGSEENNSIVIASKEEGCFDALWGIGLVKFRVSVT